MQSNPDSDHPVQPFLAGLKFPADKDRLLEAALHNHAPRVVLDLLEHLQRQNFVVPQDVIEAYDAIRHLRADAGRKAAT